MVKLKKYKLYIYSDYLQEELNPITLKAKSVNDAFKRYYVKKLPQKYEGADVRRMYLMERKGRKLVPKQVYPK